MVELPVKPDCQSSSFTSKLGQIEQIGIWLEGKFINVFKENWKQSCQLIRTANPALFSLHLNFEIFALQFMPLIVWLIAGVNVRKTYYSLIWISVLSVKSSWNRYNFLIFEKNSLLFSVQLSTANSVIGLIRK